MVYSYYTPYDKETYGLNTPEYKKWLKEYQKIWRERNASYLKEQYRKKYDTNRYCEVCEKEVSIMNNYHDTSKKHLQLLNKKKDGYNY